ncbi:11278_t:CDS:10 [Ambispora leptoticha]|uniref:oligopeptidase A n=1 Tax=Ambispora leptoticha TaxID=144679 RepID=A0A9N9GHP2_9GLOM|nr:11278_t:CDS:10 [Ambispora leptoticha]
MAQQVATHGPRSAKWPFAHMARETWSKFHKVRVSRVNEKKHWAHPKDRIKLWKILEGDTVKIISGKAKGQVGKVTSIDKWTNKVIVENCNIGLKTPKEFNPSPKPPPPPEQRVGPWWMVEFERPIHVSNVQLVHPNDLNLSDPKQMRVVKCRWKCIEITNDPKKKDRFRWRRFISGIPGEQHIQIELPKREKKDPEAEQEVLNRLNRQATTRLESFGRRRIFLLPTQRAHHLLLTNSIASFASMANVGLDKSPFWIAKTPEERENPVLNWDKFPNFAAITPENILSALEILLPRVEKEFLKREKNFSPTWEGSIGLVQDLEDDLERAVNIPKHLKNVKESKELREVIEKMQPKITELTLRMNQSYPLYQALTKLANTPESFASLSPAQQRVVQLNIQQMQLTGVGLVDGSPEKTRFNEIRNRLSKISLNFADNVLDATKAFAEIVKDREALRGCPDQLLKHMAKSAKNKGFGDGDPEKGPWAVTLDEPCIAPFLKFCANRSLREKVYRGLNARASTEGVNNEPIINEILKLRNEEASLLGFPHFAALSLSHKMAGTLESANKLIQDIFEAAMPVAKREFEELTLFAKNQLELNLPIKPWDVPYVAEEYRKHLFKYSDDEISKYFTFHKVINGLFELTEELLGVRVQAVDQKKEGFTTWHKDVKVYKIVDKSTEAPLAYFYGDFYSRPEEKKGGAWVDLCATRSKDFKTGQVRVPVGYVNCNAPPPSTNSSTPSTMTFRDVETIFHEFGHGLQHSLTTVDLPQVSGIKGIEWDFVEVASQFMENFIYEPEIISRLSAHVETGKPMPKDMIDSLVKNRQYLAGMMATRQLHFAQVDLTLHSNFTPPEPTAVNANQKTVFDLYKELAQRMLVTPVLPEDRFLCSFLHIFSGMYSDGYSAGYYSYKWSEVYSVDAYAAFEEAVENLPPEEKKAKLAEIGRHYRETLLSLGGSIHPRQVWKLFRGREEADIRPMLRHSGLLSG